LEIADPPKQMKAEVSFWWRGFLWFSPRTLRGMSVNAVLGGWSNIPFDLNESPLNRVKYYDEIQTMHSPFDFWWHSLSRCGWLPRLHLNGSVCSAAIGLRKMKRSSHLWTISSFSTSPT
jgi:hypothetical protein